MARRLLEVGLIVTGLISIGICAQSYFRFQQFQARSKIIHTAQPSNLGSVAKRKNNAHPVIGRISIRRLGFEVSMVDGDDEESLDLAAGHMPGTAWTGEVGNMIVAGHRDNAFWPLRNIRSGDQIEVQTDRKATYLVEQTQIVDPSDVSALRDTQDSTLTLVTCYPFRHVGPAPQRFIVRAKLSKAQQKGK